MDLSDFKSKIFYCCREQIYNVMLMTCKDAIGRFGSEISLHFCNALALALCNRFQESIRELEALQFENDVKLSVTVALMYANKLSGFMDKENFAKLDGKMRELKKNANAIDFYHTSYVMFAYKKFDKSLEFIERSLVLQNDSESLSLKGWILLNLQQLGVKNEAVASPIFEESLQKNTRNLDAALGLSDSYLLEKNKEEAANTINKAVVRFPASNLPLIQKARLQFSLQDWDQITELLNRIFSDDSNNLEALQLNAVCFILKESNYEEGLKYLKKFVGELEKQEPRNASVFYENSVLFSRISGRNLSILNESYTLIEKAVQIFPNNTDYVTELGYQSFFKGNIKEAARLYKSATKINDSSIKALVGMTLCELNETGRSEHVRQQIEFLVEFQESNVNPLLIYMQAKLADDSDEALKLLEEAFQIQLKLVKHVPYGYKYLKLIDPDFLLQLAKEFLQHSPNSASDLISKQKSVKNLPVLDAALKILKTITNAFPGFKEALFLQANVQFLKSDFTEAAHTLQHILNDIDPTSTDAYILLAQIQIKMGLYERAAQNLEVGLSHNFKVRDNAVYHLITGLVEKKRGNIDESIKSLNFALNIIDTKQSTNTSFTLSNKATIYTELIDSYLQSKQVHEATKLIQDALGVFEGTQEEARIVILSADHAVGKKNIQHAIDLLSKVSPGESYYLEAKTKLANIYLKQRRDKRAYLQCYQEIVEHNSGPEGLVSLGDAYMNILEIDLALESYEKALKMNPKDPYLTSKMGSALVNTHYFARAVTYYKETIKMTDDPALKLQLIKLYILLKQYDNAEKLITVEIELEKNKKLDDITGLKYRTKLLVLLADVQEKIGNSKAAQNTLKEARDNQNRVRKLFVMEQTVMPQEETDKSIEISMKLAELCKNLKENEVAINYYQDALKISPNHPKALMALAKQYMQMNYLDMCQQVCTTILNLEPENEIASVMMADIAFRKIDFDMAQFHFMQLLNKQPINWAALIRLVEIMRRTGNLDDVPQYLKQAEKSSNSLRKEAGLCYASALYEWYTGNLNAALRNFNNARQDSQWGQQAIINMIEICLNPDDEVLGEQFVDDDLEYRDSRSMALKTAQRLLSELTTKPNLSLDDTLKYRLLNNFLLLATKEKHNIEQALEDFISMAYKDPEQENVGTVLGLATAYTLLKQGQRAKNQLKRIVKRTWTFEEAEYLERCWLLLADSYVQSSKYDLATDLLKRVLQHNKSSSKAYEYSGFISEKEQRYKDAANCFENAWKYGGKNNPVVGYKLAFNLMKCKKFADAIDVCQQVLKSHPDYPKMKKDILDKSMNNLRS